MAELAHSAFDDHTTPSKNDVLKYTQQKMSNEHKYLIKIAYFLELSSDGNSSFPNHYDSRLIEIVKVIEKIASLQKDIPEIYCDKEHAIRNRMIGVFDGHQIQTVKSVEEVKDSPYAVKILFTETPPDAHLIDAQTIVVLIDNHPAVNAKYLHLDNFTPSLLKDKALAIISRLEDDQRALLEELKNQIGFEPTYSQLEVATEVKEGFYTRINIAVLDALRLKVRKTGTSSEFDRDEIIDLVNRIIQIRAHIANTMGLAGMDPAVEMYFSDTSSSFEFYKDKRSYTEAALRSRGVQDGKALVQAIKVSDRGLVGDIDSTNPFIVSLENERRLVDSLIVLSAANNAAPVVKLPLSNNRAFSQVVNLASSDRGDGRKTNALMKQVREAFSQYLDEWLEYADESPSLAIKLISNFPLEWTYHQGLPLMVRHEVSRIPMTPGYVTSSLLLDSDVVHLSPDSFREILFISSFADDDPIRNDLKDKVNLIQKNLSTERLGPSIDRFKASGALASGYEMPREINRLEIRFKWVEVSDRDELIEAINSNPCAMTVFDLHGSHRNEVGGLMHLKNETVTIFDIYDKIHVSPIVILSTCDTSPVDKGHESTAEAFFLAGAKTIISSALPIESDLASTFLVRLLERIRSYLPERLECHGPIRWSTLVSGMIRRTYYYELISLLQRSLNFSTELKIDLLFRIGTMLDPLRPDWVDRVTEQITSKLGISVAYLNDFVLKNGQFLECMKYFQFGRPELVVLGDLVGERSTGTRRLTSLPRR
ncbi:CHAT domain-containing protein [Paraburkholderia sp. RL17-337-BIB-A]|uniref:hypothetical protein n=1 Tax=Paraburkholderia sp. RL17-337-BIB-A TaxID=3031636 RepID=UPI0038BC92E2